MLQHDRLLISASKLGMRVRDVSDLMRKSAAILKHNDLSELIVSGVPASWVSLKSLHFCDNKQLAKQVFEDLNIPHPASLVFENPDDPVLADFQWQERSYVCKPIDGSDGKGVVLHINSMDSLKAYFEEFSHLEGLFLLEEQLNGEDLRLQVIGGKIVAACIRKPAFVIGNGQATLQKLIEERKQIMRVQNPDNRLEIDSSTRQLLAEQQITMGDIPVEGRCIRLKHVSNMAQGGIAVDVTDKIHPIFTEWATALCEYLGTGYMGIDFITTDYRSEAPIRSAALEINARAEWLHHTFSERRNHDIPGIILRELFHLPASENS